ncbi:MAG: NAD(P)/FAD-dependent oxidoreductase [Eubacteriaceae bacterium]|nr:NAD(P)/FAD-dependent oxidoreductase [Eubacteriaceae bacterium]
MQNNHYHTLIVGGGPGGILAALSAREQGREVFLVEQNEKLGKKLYITGKGRCNLTNACDSQTFFSNIIRNPRFMYSALYGFDQQALMNLVEAEGCPLKIERGERVFPVSDKSSDIIRALQKALQKRGVQIMLNTRVENIMLDSAGTMAVGVALKTGQKITADKIVMATGGITYRSTGSDGSGLAMVKKLGHHIIPCRPSLTGLETREGWPARAQGLTLKNVDVSLWHNEKDIKTIRGEVLLTHFGVSGPVILSMSAFIEQDPQAYHLTLDLKPALSDQQLNDRVLRDFEEFNNKDLDNALVQLLPGKMIPIVLNLSELDVRKKVNQITKAERKKLIYRLKHLELQVTDYYDTNAAIVTAGGVDVKEVDPKTMASKKIDHLFFAGEMLDVDGLTGGFNIQIAASTGYAAGRES